MVRAAVVLALLISFCIDLAHTAKSGASDFRSRIVGIRLLEHGMNAYTYHWHPGDLEQYCIPNDPPQSPVDGVTVTPALLMLHLPLAIFNYRVAQFLWLIAQWLMLLGTGWLWLRACSLPLERWLVMLFVVGFTYTVSWRLHAERGQAYILLAFLFSCWLTTTLDPKRGNGFAPGFLAGILIALRPPFLLLVPFLALHRRGQWAGAATGLLLGFGLPLLMNSACWSDYFAAMKIHSGLYETGMHLPHTSQILPSTIEDIPLNLIENFASIPYSDFSGHALLVRFGSAAFAGQRLVILFALAFVLWLGCFRRQPLESLLSGLVAWLFLVDLFLPAARYSYYDVSILNVFCCGLIAARKIPLAAWPCALALPLGWAVYALSPARPLLINLPEIFFVLGAILFLFPIVRKAIAPSPEYRR
jgi:hypothetical protein